MITYCWDFAWWSGCLHYDWWLPVVFSLMSSAAGFLVTIALAGWRRR